MLGKTISFTAVAAAGEDETEGQRRKGVVYSQIELAIPCFAGQWKLLLKLK